MIGKVDIGASSYHCLSYCLEDKRHLSEEQKQQLTLQDNLQHKNRAEIIAWNLCNGDKRQLAGQFKEVEKLSKRVEKPVIHLTIRAAPGDKLTNAQWQEIGQAAAQEFGLSDHQYVCILHKDTKQPHIHIVGNRVGFDGKVASDSNSYGRMAKLCRELEKKYNLRQVLSPRRFLSPKERQIPRNDERKEQLKTDIRNVLRHSTSYQDFEKAMQEKGYRIEKGRGIAFEDSKKVRVKGSEVGYPLSTIERILSQNAQKQMELPRPSRPSNEGQKSVSDKDNEKNLDFDKSRNMKAHSNDLIDLLLKPELEFDGGPSQSDDANRKRKRKGRSL
jgi:hypothetical protein